jgi:UDP-N-acetyl-D-galactosamine dehydrogenase
VYPGVTDEICTPILEEKSSLIFNEEFSTGYSPERIVPGDRVNTIEKIKKVVSGSNKTH